MVMETVMEYGMAESQYVNRISIIIATGREERKMVHVAGLTCG